MKKALVGIAFLVILTAFVAAGFWLGFQVQERLLAKSDRNPVKLETQIATLEVEKTALTDQVTELHRQVEAGVKNQTEKAAQVASLETQVKELKAEVEQLRAKLNPAPNQAVP